MRQKTTLLALVGLLAIAAVACGGNTTDTTGGEDGRLSGSIRVDGSSTVGPLTEAAAELFQQESPGVRVTVGISGTGGGFEKFCNGETDISDASRPIKDEEKQACDKKDIKYAETQVANDGLSVVVSRQNTWASCLTVDQLKRVWERASKVNNWNQIDESFPSEPLKLFGAGTDSGTFDYFTEAINGEQGNSRTDYQATEDDNVTVQGVSGTKGGLGYLGLSYYEENQSKLKVLQVDGGSGCVTPSKATVQSGAYKPLSRPLFIYVKDASLKRRVVDEFIKYYIDNADRIATQAKFVPMTDQQAAAASKAVDELIP